MSAVVLTTVNIHNQSEFITHGLRATSNWFQIMAYRLTQISVVNGFVITMGKGDTQEKRTKADCLFIGKNPSGPLSFSVPEAPICPHGGASEDHSGASFPFPPTSSLAFFLVQGLDKGKVMVISRAILTPDSPPGEGAGGIST